MPGTPPPPAFSGVALDIATIAAGEVFGRIYRTAFPDPVGFGKAPSRFSDPRRRVAANRFGVLYLGSSLKVCFLEAILRDDRDGVVGDVMVAESELTERRYAEIRVHAPLRLLDLRDDSAVRMGVPSDVVRGSNQTLARRWAVAFHDHPAAIDGVIYPSRLNGQINVAIFDRSVAKLEPLRVRPLLHAPRLADVLDDLLVALD